MGNIEKQEPLYYKSLRLVSESLMVTIKEKAPWTEGRIEIFHSPTKFELDRGTIVLKDGKALDEYIAMLNQFRDEYKEEITQLTARKKDATA